MLNEGEKCRKSTYYSIMNNALPTWGKALLCCLQAYSSISERLLTKLLKKLLVVSTGAYLT